MRNTDLPYIPTLVPEYFCWIVSAQRLCITRPIPYSLIRKRIWIREDDIVLVEPWDWQDEKADITWRYENSEAEQLRQEGHLQ